MPFAWEQRERKSVLIAILSVEYTTVAWALGLNSLIKPGPTSIVSGLPFDHARNSACMQALDHGFDYLFFLDSDVVPPKDAIVRLIAHNQPLVSGLYFRRSPPAGIPVMQRPVGVWVTDYPEGKVIEVDVVGAGCLLIHRDLLQKMKPQRPKEGKHWFHWRVDQKNLDPLPLSEDFTFCIAAKQQLGVKTLVDTSIVCKHIGHGQASRGKFEPMNLDIPV